MQDLKTQYQAIKPEIDEAVHRVLDSQEFILGDEVEYFEKEICSRLLCKHAIGVSSGTDAILAALMAIGTGPGDEVIVPAYSFISTASCVSRLGAIPVFCDIDPLTYNINIDKLLPLINYKTKAVIPVHIAGQMADMTRLMQMADVMGLYIIEDACQALGASEHMSMAGTVGDIGCFSFYPSKNLGGYGDSGMVVTDDEDLARRLRVIRSHGQDFKYHSLIIGGNLRMDAIQAAVLRVKLKYLPTWNKHRRYLADRYKYFLSDLNIGVPFEAPNKHHIYHLFMTRHENRDDLRKYLRERGVDTNVYYPTALPDQPCYWDSAYVTGLSVPEARRAARESLALPLYPELGLSDQEYVSACIHDFYRGTS
jgi:dTDP-4-amino-4,6-dideoxygalactose transaminase